MDQPPLPDIDPYVNRNLFSDHFLKELLPQDESWQVDEGRLKLAMQAVTNLYAGREEEWAGSNEPQLENRLVRPMLQALGHKFEVQPSLPTAETVRRPDYAFFGTDEERLRAKRDHDGQAEYFNKAIAIGDAKRWDRSLDKKERSGRDSFDMLSPSWQIDHYLRMSGVHWGILTNGRLWRLYNQETSFRLDICYEIDLPRLLAAKDLETFKYFYLFFRHQAFVPDSEGLCFLDRVYQGSLEYAQAVGDDLKENVYKALRLLAEGFLRTRGNDLDPVRDLDEIHANSLVLLYRLLFINYAEDRGLLPRENALYKESYGLVSMEREIASRVQRGDSLSPLHTTYCGRLKTLFELINRGTEGLGVEAGTMEVPPYNGGLFDPTKHPFLEQHEVADKWVAQVVDLLARSQGKGVGRGFVDYSSLDVRHLGSIYEGLLEYKLRVADEEMVAVKRRGKDQWTPASEAVSSRVLESVQPGSVYLATDRGERKATGSYYTPDYIVKYIVEHTVGPLIEEKMKEDDPIEGILSLKVLDPAMGSGHFLVEATDRLAHALVQALGVTEQEPEEEDIRWARREVVERCIYGVDLNPLAVELAKLSLWLHTVAEGKPLSFLDHHLKVGNSLIGAWVDDLGSLPAPRKRGKADQKVSRVRQMNLFETRLDERLPTMLSAVLEIMRRGSETLEDIKAKTAADHAIEELKDPFKAVADLWVSTYFGNDLSKSEYQEALEHIGEPGQLLSLPAVERGREIGGAKRFFHWEVEFPEVFYEDSKRRENSGFDAVVGNPPYIPTEQLSQEEKRTYVERFAVERKYETSVIFVQVGLRLTSVNGRVGMITPTMWQTGENYKRYRTELLTESFQPLILINLPFDVFPDAYIDTGIQIVGRPPGTDAKMTVLEYPKHEKVSAIADTDSRWQQVPWRYVQQEPCARVYLDEAQYRMRRKLRGDDYVSLGSLTDSCQGIVESFYEYSDTPQAHAQLEYRTLEVYRYEATTLRRRFVNMAPSDSLYRFYSQPRLLIRRLVSRANRLMAVRADQPFVVRKDLNPFIMKDPSRVDLGYLLSVVNSRLLAFIYTGGSAASLRDDFRQTTLAELRALPVRRIDFTTPFGRREQLGEMGRQIYGKSVREGHSGVLEFVEHHLTAGQIDVVHDFLAYLADQMIDMNKQKRAEAKGLVDWLVGYTGVPIEQWRLKTIVKTYWEQGWDEFQRAVRQNRNAIEQASGRDVESREAQESIRGEFDKSTAKLDPLLKRIASTDRLIDLIVYRLYGLTEEEVAIVEESLAD